MERAGRFALMAGLCLPASAAQAQGVPAAVPGVSVSGGVMLPTWTGTQVITYRPQVVGVWTPDGWMPYAPPLIVVAPGGGFPEPLEPVMPLEDATLAAPLPVVAPNLGAPVPPPPRPRPAMVDRALARPDRARVAELVTLGDRHFRAGDLRRAEGRYGQALRLDAGDAEARFRLVQVALQRGAIEEAAHRLRETVAVDPEWPRRATDAQALFLEPADFAAVVQRLEMRVQAHPEDRDAWLLLAAELFLSGREAPARDILMRLTDRPADTTLRAFLDAAGLLAEVRVP